MEDKEENDIGKKKLNTHHPKEKSNILSHLFFCWQLPVIINGLKEEFTEKHLFETPKDHRAKNLGDKLKLFWEEEVNTHKKPSFKRAIIKLIGGQFLIYNIIFLPLKLMVTVLLPLTFEKLLQYFTPIQTAISTQEAYIFAALLILLCFLDVLVHHLFVLVFTTIGMKVRIACTSLIYRKCLKMKQNKITMGQIMNLMSNDVNRFNDAFNFLFFFWVTPIESVIILYFLYTMLGYTATVGFGVLLLYFFPQVYLSKKLSMYRMKIASKTDHRMHLINEIIHGIQIIKMYVWQKPFAKFTELARKYELDNITTANYIRIFYLTNKFFIIKLCLYFCILGSVLNGAPPSAQYYFTALTMYEALRISILQFIPFGVINFSEAKISAERIEKFLISTTRKNSSEIRNCILKKIKMESTVIGIYAHNVFVKWDQSQENYTLNDVTIKVSSNELIAITGPAGSGKSTLLQTILKEVDIVKGSLQVFGTVSYASQEPWIFKTSIKQNILFGRGMNFEKYRKVIRVCALEHDLSLFPYGDRTVVGERGVKLSGGQKARINLARAVYRDADIYLMDDPLSAVDAHVAKHIFEECILGYLSTKCVVLVTHQIQFLKNVKMYTMDNGVLKSCANYEELSSIKKKTVVLGDIQLKSKIPSTQDKEHRTSGVNGFKTFKKYYLATGKGWFSFFFILFLYILGHTASGSVDYFVMFWINLEEESKGHNLIKKRYQNQSDFVNIVNWREKPFFTTENCLYIYSFLIFSLLSLLILRCWYFVKLAAKISKNLHNKLLTNVVNATMKFFNVHPSGRIINRFSNDIGIIDEILPPLLTDAVNIILNCLTALTLVSLTNPWLSIPSLMLILIVYGCSHVITRVNKNLKRTEAITRSLVLSHLVASLKGLATIRACEAEEILKEEFNKHLDVNTSAFYMIPALQICLCFWVDLISVLYVICVVISVFFSDIQTGTIGLAIIMALLLKKTLAFGLKNWCDVENCMISVERIMEYTQLELEQENGIKMISETWPSEGNIEFQSIFLKYSVDDPYVLNQVNFKINAGEKIGIVGRTGAGKSSLISVLFRLFNFEGKIIIDEYDTKEISLDSLRSKISIIPQEPMLFSTTLRKNLDPFDEYSDSDIWSALNEVELRNISSLDNIILEGGSNFSVGEKQLLCLARALLRKNKIIVLDEATANVDLTTDKLIQTTIREKFKNCTVLTIAHRLHTIMDSDKVLVMDSGRVVEFDSPRSLLQNSTGFFYALHYKTT